MTMTHHTPRGHIIARIHRGAPLSGMPTVYVLEELPNILRQTAEVETRSGEIVLREVVDQFDDGHRVREIVLDPMRALVIGEEMIRQALEAMGHV